MERFQERYADLMGQAALGTMNHVATLEEIMSGYAGGRTLQTEEGSVDMTTTAAKQLFAKVGLDVKTMKSFDKWPDLQRQMVAARLSETADADQSLVARGVEGDSIHAKGGWHAYGATSIATP